MITITSRWCVYTLSLSLWLGSIVFGIGLADSPIEAKWKIDLGKMGINYSITNKTSELIRFTPDLIVFRRRVDERLQAPNYGPDSMVHPYIELVTSQKVAGGTVNTHVGTPPPPVEIKSGETKSFSYSLADANLFPDDPKDVAQIESAQCMLILNGKIIYKIELKYEAGKWKINIP